MSKRRRSLFNDRVFKRSKTPFSDRVFQRGFAPLSKKTLLFPLLRARGRDNRLPFLLEFKPENVKGKLDF